MNGPVLDLANPAVWRMLKFAKKRGYVTQGELNEVLPPEEFSSEQIETVVRQLSKMGIKILKTERDARS